MRAEPWREVLALSLMIAAFPATASAGPITFSTALPVRTGGVILREQAIWTHAPNGPAPEFATGNVLALPMLLVWGAHTRLTVMANLPFLVKDVAVASPSGGRVHRRTHGFGDTSILLRLNAYQANARGRTLRIAPFAVLKLPTGTDSEADSIARLPPRMQLGTGSWDPYAGVILTWQTLDFELDMSLSGFYRTAANQFDAGDELRADVSFQYRVLPWGELSGSGVPTFLYAVLEGRAAWLGKDSGSRAATRSGGAVVRVTPGLQLVTVRYVLEAAVEIPVAQPPGTHVIAIPRLSFRANF